MTNVVFKIRRGTAADWSEVDPVLRDGEPGIAVDTNVFKIGDGVLPWNQLDSVIDPDVIAAIIQQIIDDNGGISADPRIGLLEDLTTEDKTLIVSAINEINMADVSLVLLYDNAKAG